MRNTRGGPLRLISTLRGEGALLGAAAPIAVHYQVDLFTRGAMIIATGEVEGRLSALRGKLGAFRLRLDDGCLIEVRLTETGPDFAAFEADEASARLCHDRGPQRDAAASAGVAASEGL